MAATSPLKKLSYRKEWMVQADPSNEASMFERVNIQSKLLTSSKMTHYLNNWKTAIGVLKKIYCFYNNLRLQIDPFNGSCS